MPAPRPQPVADSYPSGYYSVCYMAQCGWIPPARKATSGHDNLSVSTPVLFLHGELDQLVTIWQSHELYNALKRRGVPAQMAVYPRTGHVHAEPGLLLDIMNRILEWMECFRDITACSRNKVSRLMTAKSFRSITFSIWIFAMPMKARIRCLYAGRADVDLFRQRSSCKFRSSHPVPFGRRSDCRPVTRLGFHRSSAYW